MSLKSNPSPRPEKSCANNTPPWFIGHWRDWHRGHGCEKDDGKLRSEDARVEIEQHAANEATGYLTDAELRFLRARTTSGDTLLVRALDELAERRGLGKEKSRRGSGQERDIARFDHSARTSKYFMPSLGVCVCEHCAKLPEHEPLAKEAP